MRAALLWAALAATPAIAAPPPFCTARPEKGARPDFTPLDKVGAPDAPQAKGAWTWVNLWAVWCGPCVDELPRLEAFQQALGGPSALRLALISVDEMRAEVESHVAEARLKGAWWAPPGARRTAVMRSLGLDGGILPTQVLINPKGEVVCVHEGAVEEAHLPAIRARLARP